MKILLSSIVAVLLVSSNLTAQLFHPLKPRQQKAVVLIKSSTGSTCTAFYVSLVHLLSAAHCDNKQMSVGRLPLTRLKVDVENDLVLYWVNKHQGRVLELAEKPAKRGDTAWIYSRFSNNYIIHPVSILTPEILIHPLGKSFVWMRPSLVGGQSGSPIVNFEGKVVGVAVRSASPVGPHSGTSLGVMLKDIRSFLKH
jgi:V8-like Glu-specific endopeptidase